MIDTPVDLELKPRTFVKLGFTHLETAEIVEALNKLLINYHIHYQKLRNFHWNVEGPDFFELHEKFEQLYTIVYNNIDQVAERIRVFDKRPVSTMQEYVTLAEIKEVREPLTSYQMVKEVLADYEKLLSFIMDVTNSANRIGDSGTVDMMTSFTRAMEKDHWMLTSWLKNQK